MFCNLFLWLLLLTRRFKYVISFRTLVSNCNPVCINENYDSGMVSASFEGCLEGAYLPSSTISNYNSLVG